MHLNELEYVNQEYSIRLLYTLVNFLIDSSPNPLIVGSLK